MYTIKKAQKTNIRRNESYIAETIEQKVHRITTNKEPIKDGAPIIYTERKDGVNPAYDIRTDRWEIAVDAMDKVTADRLAKREQRHNKKDEGGGGDATEALPRTEVIPRPNNSAKE